MKNEKLLQNFKYMDELLEKLCQKRMSCEPNAKYWLDLVLPIR